MSDVAAAPRPPNRLPALSAAILLHAAVLAALMTTPRSPPLPIGSSVPVNIVSEAAFTDSRPAVQAPRMQNAAAPEPQPKAPSQAPTGRPGPPAFAAPEPKPKPAERAPAPEAASSATQVERKVTQQPAQKAAAAPARSLDFSKLQQIIESARRSSGEAASSAHQGPVRPETAAKARPDAGKGLSQSDLAGLEQLLERLWNPNCDVAGGAAVRLKIKFLVGLSGNLLGAPAVIEGAHAGDSVVSAATLRALDAVREAAPYGEPYYGQTIIVNFDAKEACAKR